MDNLVNYKYFKYILSKICLILAIIIAASFFILRIVISYHNTQSIILAGIITLFLISVYIILINYKEKLDIIQLITFFTIITFIAIQAILTKDNAFLPVWIDFAVLISFIIGNRKSATIIALYALMIISALKFNGCFTHSMFTFLTIILSLIAFSILGYLISMEFDIYNQKILQQNQKLERLALIDELTNTFNRRAFYIFSKKMLIQAIRANKCISIIMMDLDFFKKINDQYGHHIGDIVLKQFVNRLKSIIRENDFFARIGGEEFVLLLYDTEKQQAKIIAEKIVRTISEKPIEIENDLKINLTVSLGVYSFKPDETTQDITKALIKADRALYEAKKTGRNKVVVF